MSPVHVLLCSLETHIHTHSQRTRIHMYVHTWPGEICTWGEVALPCTYVNTQSTHWMYDYDGDTYDWWRPGDIPGDIVMLYFAYLTESVWPWHRQSFMQRGESAKYRLFTVDFILDNMSRGLYSLVPRPFFAGEEKRPGTICLHIPRKSGDVLIIRCTLTLRKPDYFTEILQEILGMR